MIELYTLGEDDIEVKGLLEDGGLWDSLEELTQTQEKTPELIGLKVYKITIEEVPCPAQKI